MDRVLRPGARLQRAFFARRAPVVARALIGTILLHDGVGGVVVETEAYDALDPASHSFRGKTVRNAPMFGPPGHAYVYFTYGVHWCFNVVCAREGVSDAVLIRALEPLAGIARMEKRRGAAVTARDLARGPGRLAQALGIDKRFDAADLVDGPIGFYRPVTRVRRRIVAGPRVGISKAEATPWRFYDETSRFVSRLPAKGRR